MAITRTVSKPALRRTSQPVSRLTSLLTARLSDAYARWGLTPIWGMSLRLPHRVGRAKTPEIMLTCPSYSETEAQAMHLVNLCFADDQFEKELAALCKDILANSWYANQVDKRALIESDGLSLHDAHALELFKNEGLAPDAEQRVVSFSRHGDSSLRALLH
jgi:enoyl-CoA hydratase